jgi:hypothetical protein
MYASLKLTLEARLNHRRSSCGAPLVMLQHVCAIVRPRIRFTRSPAASSIRTMGQASQRILNRRSRIHVFMVAARQLRARANR